MDRYKIVRFFYDRSRSRRTIMTGLSLEEAQAYCKDPETSSRTCSRADRIRYTRRVGPWFDGYERD